jgi:hypothetical protein
MDGILAQINAAWMFGIAIATLILGIVGGMAALVLIPGNYFSSRRKKKSKGGSSWQQIALRIGKNIAGVAFLILGVVMMITPGPGVIFLLMGVSLVDIPGKRRLQRYLISRPAVLRTVNKIRSYWNRPKLVTS